MSYQLVVNSDISVSNASDSSDTRRRREEERERESLPTKISAPAGVYDRIHSAVDPTQPRNSGEHDLLLPYALGAKTGPEVDDEEREPTDDEDAHHDPQRLGCLLLLGELGQFARQGEIVAPVLFIDPRGRDPGQTVVVLDCSERLLEILEVLGRARGGTEQVSRVGVGSTAPMYPQSELQFTGGHQNLLGAQFQALGLDHGRPVYLVVSEHHHEQG